MGLIRMCIYIRLPVQVSECSLPGSHLLASDMYLDS